MRRRSDDPVPDRHCHVHRRHLELGRPGPDRVGADVTEIQEKQLQIYRHMAERVRNSVPETPRELPMIQYWDRFDGRYEPKVNTIFLPTPEDVAEIHGDSIEECLYDHEELFLHELAHWGTNGQGHTATMYAFLYCLAKMFGHSVLAVRKAEIAYKPRAAKAGWRTYLRTFREMT